MIDDEALTRWVGAIFDADAADRESSGHPALAGVVVELVAMVEVPVEDAALAYLLGLATHLLTYDLPSADASWWLRTAIDLAPVWPEPRIQLGCLLSQRLDWPGVLEVVAPLAGTAALGSLAPWRMTTYLALRSAAALAVDPAGAADVLGDHIAYLDRIGAEANECPWPVEVLTVLEPVGPGDIGSPEVDALVRQLVERIAASSPGGPAAASFTEVVATWSLERWLGVEHTP